MSTETAKKTIRRTPTIDIWTNESEAVLAANIPGVAQTDASVQIEEGVLTLEGRALRGPSDAQEKQTEVVYYRRLALDESIDAEAITASVSNGVLTVTLPRRAESKPRRIEVKAA